MSKFVTQNTWVVYSSHSSLATHVDVAMAGGEGDTWVSHTPHLMDRYCGTCTLPEVTLLQYLYADVVSPNWCYNDESQS